MDSGTRPTPTGGPSASTARPSRVAASGVRGHPSHRQGSVSGPRPSPLSHPGPPGWERPLRRPLEGMSCGSRAWTSVDGWKAGPSERRSIPRSRSGTRRTHLQTHIHTRPGTSTCIHSTPPHTRTNIQVLTHIHSRTDVQPHSTEERKEEYLYIQEGTNTRTYVCTI